MNKTFVVATCLFLSSCSIGVRYQTPADNQDSAEFIGHKKAFIYTFREDGCVTSYSYIGEKMRIHAKKEAYIHYSEKIGSNHMCSLWLSFMPEKDATYELKTDLERSEAEKNSIFVPIFTNATCTARIVKNSLDGSTSIVGVRQPRSLSTEMCPQEK